MTHPFRYIPRALLLAVVVVLVAGVGPAVAASAKKRPAPCWKTLINDWYDGRIDGTYAIHCYREALAHLPTDVETYSSARDDIKQALQERIAQSHKKKSGGGGGTTTSGGGSGSSSSGSGSGGSGSSSGGSGSGSGSGTGGGPIKGAFDATKPGSADSVPVPLIVLGGVAVLLMAAGAVGFLTRRARTRKLQLASLPQASPDAPHHRP